MRDFVDAAKAAADGPRNVKSQPDRSDISRAKDVAKTNANPKTIRAGLRNNTGNTSDTSGVVGGSSAGLKNQTKATLKLDGGRKENDNIRILESSQPAANMIGRTTGSRSQPVDYTRRGRSGNHNSIASLEKITQLDRKIR